MRNRSAKSLSGTSLIELMAVVSACSVVLTTTTLLLHRVMRADEEARLFSNVERNAERLSNQFRQDVHQATVVALDNSKVKEGVFLRLQLPDGQSLEYSHSDGNVLRVLSKNGKVAAREEFAFPQSTELTIQEQDSPKRLILSIASLRPQTVAGGAPRLRRYKSAPVSLQVEACVHRQNVSANTAAGEKKPK